MTHETDENPLFTMWCLDVCKAETLGMKYARWRHRPCHGLKPTGVNKCMRCGTLYEASLPPDFDVGKRRSRLRGVVAKATVQRMQQEAAERGAPPYAAAGQGPTRPRP